MKKLMLTTSVIAMLFSSCAVFSTLHSTTTIKGNDSFVLGNNEHGTFKVKLTNISNKEVEVHRAPIDGGNHSFQKVQPNETVTVNVERNTALVIANESSKTINVKLKVTGDTGLSMGYKN